MNIGSLYRVKKYCWLLFPSKESAVTTVRANAPISFPLAAGNSFADPRGAITNLAAWYSQKYKENVICFSSDLYVVLLEEDEKYKKVLTSDGLIGWTWFDEYCDDCFEEVKSE